MEQKRTVNHPAVVIGGGPAGLTAAHELIKLNRRPFVIEKHDKVGGLARTEGYQGFHFDMGGHRFFTKAPEVNRMWREVLGADLLRRPRLSRIYYERTFFSYPLKPLNALHGLGLWQSLLIVLSYIRWQVFPYQQEDTFEQWVTNRFGRRLFRTFFKAYTEKVWGIPCSELKAEWAAQRIKELSLKTALLSMFLKPQQTIKTLIEQFDYPRLGPGMLWTAVKDHIETRGGIVRLNTDVTRIHRRRSRIDSVTVSCNGHQEIIAGTDFISSMPVSEFIQKLDPPPPPKVLEAAATLHYRDFLTVCLIVNRPQVFPDNWIYIHDPAVNVGRIQNFKNWSPDMVPDHTKTSLGLEYFCTQGDTLWNMPDADLIELGKREVACIGLARSEDITDGCVFRVPKAYPVYDSGYRNALAIVRQFMDALKNCQTIGRNGLHRYNNQDHAMLTGMLAVRNLVLGEKHNLWNVNTDQAYHEEVRGGVSPQDVVAVAQRALPGVFPKLDRLAFGLAVAIASGAALTLATLWMTLQGEGAGGPNLQLLSQYFPGYRVSVGGSLIGLVYALSTGFLMGWGFAFLRNAALFLGMAVVYRRAEHHLLRKLLEYL